MRRFVVIAAALSSGDRSYFELRDDAIAHASRIMANRVPADKQIRMLVCEVLDVVELASPPVTVRALQEGDLK